MWGCECMYVAGHEVPARYSNTMPVATLMAQFTRSVHAPAAAGTAGPPAPAETTSDAERASAVITATRRARTPSRRGAAAAAAAAASVQPTPAPAPALKRAREPAAASDSITLKVRSHALEDGVRDGACVFVCVCVWNSSRLNGHGLDPTR